MPHLVIDGNYSELVVPVSQDGNRVWFDRPLFFRHSNAIIASMASKKIDPSYAQQQTDGSWRGVHDRLWSPAWRVR